MFTLLPLVACWRYEPREHLRPLAIARAAIPPSPLRDRVGYSDHDRFRGYVPVHCRSCLQPPCLRFATAVTGRHARLGSRLLARLCRGRHRRRQTSTRLQGATLIKPDVQFSRIRLSDRFHHKAHVGDTLRTRFSTSTPGFPWISRENRLTPRPGALCRLRRKASTRSKTCRSTA